MQLAETLAVAQEQVEKIRGELVGIEREIGGLEAAQLSIRQTADTAQQELSAHEVKLAESRQRAEFAAAEALREFQSDIATIDWKFLLWHADDEPEGLKDLDLDEEEASPAETVAPVVAAERRRRGGTGGKKVRRKKDKNRGEPTEADRAALDATDWDAVKAEADALRQRLSSMGAVNLVAIEEYAELKQRHDFLKGQSDDLVGARAELTKAISEINQTSQQQFAVTFEQIRKNFAYTFQTLFGGGHAALELVETDDDVLESGVEIVAQPPGTRLKGITLLSGGQKALTAVALLFALYMVKPSPFCLPRRARCPAGRVEHRALHRPAAEVRQGVPVRHHHPQQADGRRGRHDLWGDHGGAGRVEDDFDALQPRARRSGGPSPQHRRIGHRRAGGGADAGLGMKYLLIDGFNIAYRCFFAIPDLSRADGFPTNALHGWVKSPVETFRPGRSPTPPSYSSIWAARRTAWRCTRNTKAQRAEIARGAGQAAPAHQVDHPGHGPGRD